MIKYIDSHIHAHEYSLEELKTFSSTTVLVGVSEDMESSNITLKLSDELEDFVPCVGIHPWEALRASEKDVSTIGELLSTMNKPCLGEVGLDRKFTPETIDKQKEVFEKLLYYAQKYNAIVNLHTAGTWRETFEFVRDHGISKAVFHWYTGPLDLIEKIVSLGYYISVNAAALVQKKSIDVIKRTPIEMMLTESDGPYKYRGGLMLGPKLIPRLYQLISSLKGLNLSSLSETIYGNYQKLFGR